ncbi:GNAT family N-acetyltransferase [Methanosarcina acetivorans]|uniref:GNAT family N-acetyltransferase n=1 Tax=Methanosarcina acetivorans TaxID=2214 RepID=UPI0031F6AC92
MGSGRFLAYEKRTLSQGTHYFLAPGYATKAVKSMLQRVFSSLKGDFIIAYTCPHMKASIRVLEKNRFLLKEPCPKRE